MLTRTPVPEDSDLINRLREKTASLKPGEAPIILDEDDVEIPEELISGKFGIGSFLEGNLVDLVDGDIDARVEETVSGKDLAWSATEEEMLRTSLSLFAQEVLQGPPEPPYNGHFIVGPHHLEWDRLQSEDDRLCILAPRDSGKTYFFDFAYPLWRAAFEPNGIGFIFSATQPQAERILEDIRNEVESNPALKFLEPAKKAQWSSTRLTFSNGHKIYARGFGTKVRGAHPTWIVVDDALNDESEYSELVRKKQIEYFYTAITNMIVPGGQIIVIGTPYHALDLYGDLEKNKQYKFKRYQAITEDGKPLWPARYDKARLDKRREEIGSIRFTREFLCDPISDNMSLFPGHLFRGDPTEQFQLTLGMPLSYWQNLGVQIYMGVDFAMSSSVSADYTAIFVMGLDALGNRWIVDIVREKGMAYQDQLSLINTIGKKYEAGLIYLEANQMQRIFGDELIRTTDLPVKKFVTGVQKNSLDKGVPSLRVLLENQKFRIPRGDARSIEITDQWIDEMRAFTWMNGKLQGVGAHDDLVLSAWICDQAVRQGAFGFSFGTEDEYKNTEGFEAFLREQTGESTPGDKAAPSEPKAKGDLVGDEDTHGLPPGLNFGYGW